MKVAEGMDDSLKKWLKNALAHYDRVVFLYQSSKELYSELRTILKKEKRKILLLSDTETSDYPCGQRKLCQEECRQILELYFSYSFSDHFIFLTDQKKLPWPSIANFTEAGLLERGETLEALLK